MMMSEFIGRWTTKRLYSNYYSVRNNDIRKIPRHISDGYHMTVYQISDVGGGGGSRGYKTLHHISVILKISVFLRHPTRS